MQTPSTNWRGIVALNAVSTLAQLGQFGVGFIVLPIWLAARGMGAIELGFFGAAGWSGMLIGLLITPKLIAQFGSKKVVFASLILSSIGFVMIPFFNWPLWLLSASLIGFGMGLRWIANETWLYRIVPKNILGQVVGVHEALIALSVIIPPALVVVFSTADNKIIWLGIVFNVLALVPLMLMVSENVQVEKATKSRFFQVDKITKLGMIIAGVAGVIDGALGALFPLFGLGRGFSEAQVAILITTMGLGGLLLQYPLGWLSDKKGVIRASLLAAAICCVVTGIMAFLPMGFNALSGFGFVFGGVTAAFLTFGIIAAASAHDDEHMVENISKISIAFTVCSIAGSLLAGFAAASLGSDALLWLVILASAALVVVFARQHKFVI